MNFNLFFVFNFIPFIEDSNDLQIESCVAYVETRPKNLDFIFTLSTVFHIYCVCVTLNFLYNFGDVFLCGSFRNIFQRSERFYLDLLLNTSSTKNHEI